MTINVTRLGHRLWVLAAAAIVFCRPAAAENVLTYHNDNLRTGWNQHETALSVATVGAKSFGLLHTITVDDEVDAQPLYVAGVTVTDASQTPAHDLGKHDVLYVSTASDTVYIVDAASGAILVSRQLGDPVPRTSLPGHCGNNGPNVGITSTPVADPTQHALFVVAYEFVGKSPADKSPVYHVHKLDMSSLADLVPPRVIEASHQLSNGQTYTFVAAVQRQRPALLEANGTIYAGFGSFCDQRADIARGWVLGWSVADLTPLGTNHLVDRLQPDPLADPARVPPILPYFLSSIWMSGYGLAADGDAGVSGANIYFTTGNSDRDLGKLGRTTFSPESNLEESLVGLKPDLSVSGFFTPKELVSLDAADMDFGAGGVLVIPDRPGTAKLAASLAKAGKLYVVDRDHLGGLHAGGPDDVLGTFQGLQCWCGLSYYVGADGAERVVSSGGDRKAQTANIITWKLNRAGQPILTPDAHAALIKSGQFPGVFTSVSSNGVVPGSAIIWTVSRPLSQAVPDVFLHAINPATGALLFSSVAGTWPNVGGDANIVPVVADGRVVVASNKQVQIFGLGGVPEQTLLAANFAIELGGHDHQAAAHQLFGTVVSVGDKSGSLEVKTRNGVLITVDARRAIAAYLDLFPVKGDAVVMEGDYIEPHTFVAKSIARAKDSPALWH